MNEQKICFIYCVNDLKLYQESLKYINHLKIPKGYTIDIIKIEDATSMCSGYNSAMKKSDAKYKVYMHQDVFIINQNFIYDMLTIFRQNENIGIIGMTGAKVIPTNGIWEDAQQKYGKVYNYSLSEKMELVAFNEVESQYEMVQAISSFLIITQYDLVWGEDIFDSWEFYSTSHCIEFKNAGYNVVVPNQKEPWCIHDCRKKLFKESNIYGERFIDLYSKDIYPLVSILIPTYNRPEYFQLALESVLNQTYKNIEIIIGDDSTNYETEELVKRHYLNTNFNILYFHNEENLGQFENDLKLVELSRGNFINFLMDDDLFEPTKIEKMMEYMIQDINEDISLVTSHRGIIDDNGNKTAVFGNTEKMFQKDSIVDGRELGEFVIKNNFNCIGEPTTVLFRKKNLMEPFGTFNGRKYGCNVDQASWLNLLSNHNAVFINEILSYFRIHLGQQQHDINIKLKGFTDYAHQILTCQQKGFILEDLEYIKTIGTAIELCEKHIIQPLKEEKIDSQDYRLFEFYYNQLKELHSQTKKELPLVSILIPSYNRPNYIKEALESAINQTYPNIEIIISDDSTNDEVLKSIEPYLRIFDYIKYYKNNPSLVEKNFDRCFELANGEYINYLNDDDLFHSEKIEKMMNYYLNGNDITLVTSHRQLIDENGQKLPDNISTRRLFSKDTIINGIEFGNYILKNHNNVIGEPTTVLFRKKDLNEYFGYYRGKGLSFINDIATWLSLMSKGNAVYIAESLSYTREHREQNQKNLKYLYRNTNQRVHLLKYVREDGFLNIENDYKTALNKVLENHVAITQQYINSNKMDILNESDETINSLTFINKQMLEKDHYTCNYCGQHYKQFTSWSDKHDFPGYEFENYNKHTAICPVCQSLDRERLYKFYIEKETNLLETKQKMLHIAPEKNLRQWFSQFDNIDYTCGDLYPTDKNMLKLDITSIAFQDNSFDVVLCSHVLEHIIDDKLAMQELYRVLKSGGWGILQVPIGLSIDETYEDFSIITEEDRLKFFGQEDHVRIYAKDYVNRLESVGFKVKQYKCQESKYNHGLKELGLSDKDVLYLVEK